MMDGVMKQSGCFIATPRPRESEGFCLFGLLLPRRRNGGNAVPADTDITLCTADLDRNPGTQTQATAQK